MEAVVVAATWEVEVTTMVPHLTPLPENLSMDEENLRCLREDWQVGTALDSQGGVELSGEWSILERDELIEETILVLSFCWNRSVKWCFFRLSIYPFDVA